MPPPKLQLARGETVGRPAEDRDRAFDAAIGRKIIGLRQLQVGAQHGQKQFDEFAILPESFEARSVTPFQFA